MPEGRKTNTRIAKIENEVLYYMIGLEVVGLILLFGSQISEINGFGKTLVIGAPLYAIAIHRLFKNFNQ